MNNQVRVIVVPDESENSMYYDLDGICENADSIYWTLVPFEMFDIYESDQYFVTDYANHDYLLNMLLSGNNLNTYTISKDC